MFQATVHYANILLTMDALRFVAIEGSHVATASTKTLPVCDNGADGGSQSEPGVPE